MSSAKKHLMIAAGWLTVVGTLAWVLPALDTLELRDYLRRSQFWILETQFVLFLVLAALNLPGYLRSLHLTRTDWLSMGATCLLAGVLAGLVAPRTNRIYYDEQIYQNVGQNLADSRLAQVCNEGTVEYGSLQCWRGEYNKQPYGYPHLLSVMYRITGTSYWAANRFNVGCAVLLVGIVFLIAFGLFEDALAARFAALVMAMIPQQLLWSHTAAGEPSAALMAALAILAATNYKRTGRTAALAWMVIATVFAMQFKTESVLTVIVVGAGILIWNPSELRTPRFWGWALVGLVLCAALIAHLLAVRGENWGATGERTSLDFIAGNLRVNGPFFLADWRFPALYSVLAVAGLALSHRGREVLFCGLYFLVFWSIYLVFYAGSYNYGADIRFSLMAYPPIALLAGAGAAALVARVPPEGWPRVPVAAVLVAALLFQFTWYLPLVRRVGEEAWAARADVAFTEQFVKTLPPNSFVFTHNPNVFHLLGVNAGQLAIMTGETRYISQTLERYSGGIYVHWNFWCNVSDSAQQELCRRALDRFPTTLTGQYHERSYRYAFYRLSPPPQTAR
jgi:hypothetical protein